MIKFIYLEFNIIYKNVFLSKIIITAHKIHRLD